MTKIEFLARELTKIHIMTKKVNMIVGNPDNEINFWVEEFWHLFEDEAKEILCKLEGMK